MLLPRGPFFYESGEKSVKATGIVRRIDDLGRVVIPKEIRRTLRIREGDPLEIFVDREGEVILKKYSPIGELNEFAKEYAEALNETLNQLVLVSDRDTIIAAAGQAKKNYLNQPVGGRVEEAMEQRRTVVESNKNLYSLSKENEEMIDSFVISPIVAAGDPIGAVMIVNREGSGQSAIGETEVKMAETAASFLAKQMEQ